MLVTVINRGSVSPPNLTNCLLDFVALTFSRKLSTHRTQTTQMKQTHLQQVWDKV